MRTLAVILLLSALPVRSQDQKDPAAVYKVDFDISDDSAGADSVQHFSLLTYDSRTGIFQATSRVPTPNDKPGFVDVGIKMECSVNESGGKTTLDGSIVLSRVTGHMSLSGVSHPIIGEHRFSFQTDVRFGTAKVVIDDRNQTALDGIAPPMHGSHVVEARVTRLN